jgi:hypothetical protein
MEEEEKKMGRGGEKKIERKEGKQRGKRYFLRSKMIASRNLLDFMVSASFTLSFSSEICYKEIYFYSLLPPLSLLVSYLL